MRFTLSFILVWGVLLYWPGHRTAQSSDKQTENQLPYALNYTISNLPKSLTEEIPHYTSPLNLGLFLKIGRSYLEENWFDVISVQLSFGHFFLEFSYEEGPEKRKQTSVSLLEFIQLEGTQKDKLYILITRIGATIPLFELFPIKTGNLLEVSLSASAEGGLRFGIAELETLDKETLPVDTSTDFYLGVGTRFHLRHCLSWSKLPIIENFCLQIGAGGDYASKKTELQDIIDGSDNFGRFSVELSLAYFQ